MRKGPWFRLDSLAYPEARVTGQAGRTGLALICLATVEFQAGQRAPAFSRGWHLMICPAPRCEQVPEPVAGAASLESAGLATLVLGPAGAADSRAAAAGSGDATSAGVASAAAEEPGWAALAELLPVRDLLVVASAERIGVLGGKVSGGRASAPTRGALLQALDAAAAGSLQACSRLRARLLEATGPVAALDPGASTVCLAAANCMQLNS